LARRQALGAPGVATDVDDDHGDVDLAPGPERIARAREFADERLGT